MRNLSDDEEDKTIYEKLLDDNCNSLYEEDIHFDNKEDSKEKSSLNSNGTIALQIVEEASISAEPTNYQSETAVQLDLKNNLDTRIALRENTFVTTDGSFIASSYVSGQNNIGRNQGFGLRAPLSLTNYPPLNFEIRLSRHRRLDFDRIKSGLTVSRRGVFILQALRWVSL